MSIAKCHVAAAVYVPAGEHLNGEMLAAPAWARPGVHMLGAEFARKQDAAGMLEIESVDGAPVLWASCCGGSHG